MRYLIGAGNYSMSDDGIGLHIIEYIAGHGLARGFEAIDLAAGALGILSYLDPSTEKLLIVDCMKSNRRPGEHFFFSPGDVMTRKQLAGFSTHEDDILKTLKLAAAAGHHIPPVRIMGIEPSETGPAMELSAVLRGRLDSYAQLAIGELLA